MKWLVVIHTHQAYVKNFNRVCFVRSSRFPMPDFLDNFLMFTRVFSYGVIYSNVVCFNYIYYTNRNFRHLIALPACCCLLFIHFVCIFRMKFVNFTLKSSMLAPKRRDFILQLTHEKMHPMYGAIFLPCLCMKIMFGAENHHQIWR